MQFYEVAEGDLEQLRKEFAAGQLALDISEQPFSLKCVTSCRTGQPTSMGTCSM